MSLLVLIKVRRWPFLLHAVHMPSPLISFSLASLSPFLLVLENPLASLMITVHGLSSHEASTGQAARAKNHASARPGMPVGGITAYWTRQSVARPVDSVPLLHPYHCVEHHLPLL